MDLLQNPFYVLTATPRDNRQRITELAEERSLLMDSSECMAASSDLKKPMKRLSAEVAWLPGIGPKRVADLLATLESSPMDLLAIDKMPSIARANLLAAGLARLPEYNPDDIEDWILGLAWEFEDIDPEELGVLINDERIVSGFQEVSDLSAIEAEIQERCKHYCNVIKSALDHLSPKELVEVVTVAIETATDDGEEYSPVLLSDLVDSYEIEAQGFLEKEEENIKTIVEKLRTAVDEEKSDTLLAPMVDQLIQVVKNWDTVAQPIQVRAKSEGHDHDASIRVAWLVRDLAIHMFNNHGKINFSQQLTKMLQEVFAEVGDIAERAAEDVDFLEEIAEQRARLIEDAKRNDEKWRREITYEADVGTVFKDKLRISPEGIEWKLRCWDLESITRIRWGGTRHYVNAVHTGTIYSIFFGNKFNYATVELKKELVYNNFINCLWKAIGVRLLTEYLVGLRDGRIYRFGSSVISDNGIELERKKLFSNNERAFCRWGELVIWNGDGFFCIGKKDDKKLSAAFSYQEEDNIHVLEAAIRMFWKRGGYKLSSLLEE